MKPNDGKLRRNRQGQATAFKTPEPVLFLIEMMEGDQNQLMAYFAYYGCARINAVAWLQAEGNCQPLVAKIEAGVTS